MGHPSPLLFAVAYRSRDRRRFCTDTFVLMLPPLVHVTILKLSTCRWSQEKQYVPPLQSAAQAGLNGTYAYRENGVRRPLRGVYIWARTMRDLFGSVSWCTKKIWMLEKIRKSQKSGMNRQPRRIGSHMCVTDPVLT